MDKDITEDQAISLPVHVLLKGELLIQVKNLDSTLDILYAGSYQLLIQLYWKSIDPDWLY